MSLRHLKMRTRIFAGFTILIGLNLLTAGFGGVRLMAVSDNADTMRHLAANTGRLVTVDSQMGSLWRSQVAFQTMAKEADLKAARETAAGTADLLAEAAKASLSAQRRQVFLDIEKSLRAHDTQLAQLGELGASWLKARAALFSGGDALTAATNKLLEAVRANGDSVLNGNAAQLEASVLLVRAASWRFVAMLDPTGPITFKKTADKARDAIRQLELIIPAGIEAQIEAVRQNLAAYDANFEAFSSARLASKALFEDKIQPVTAALEQQLNQVLAARSQEFNAIASGSRETLSSMMWSAGVLVLVASVLGVIIALIIGRGIVRPLSAMTAAMSRLAAHDHAIEIPARNRHDEIGEMAQAVEVFKRQAIETERLTVEQAAERTAKDHRQAVLTEQTRDFGQSVSGVMAGLTTSAETMRRAASAMAEASQSVHDEANATSGGAVRSSQDLVAVASAIEELTSSVAEISRQVASSAEVARQAVGRAEASQQTIQGLSDATARIGDVVHLISDIASQTNLLALNATIEAARAGESGKGFAVVAGEVKALASQTAKATADIGGQIETVRTATEDTVTAMAEISRIIGRMNEVSGAISAAVEEQSATTRELASSVQAVTGATSTTADAMQHVVEVADRAGGLSQEVLHEAAEIGREADTLRREVDRFLTAVRVDDPARLAAE